MENKPDHNKNLVSTPEYYLKPTNSAEVKSIDDIDSITCALSRAKGVVGMLNTAFDGSEEYTFSNSDVCNSLWAIEGLLDQAMILTLGKYEISKEVKQ